MKQRIECSISTPERFIYEGEIDFAVLHAHDGERGYLINHTPFISQLGEGEVRLSTDRKVEYFFIEGGIVEVCDNRMIILAENAYEKSELDAAAIESQLEHLAGEISETSPFTRDGMSVRAQSRRLKLHLRVARR